MVIWLELKEQGLQTDWLLAVTNNGLTSHTLTYVQLTLKRFQKIEIRSWICNLFDYLISNIKLCLAVPTFLNLMIVLCVNKYFVAICSHNSLAAIVSFDAPPRGCTLMSLVNSRKAISITEKHERLVSTFTLDEKYIWKTLSKKNYTFAFESYMNQKKGKQWNQILKLRSWSTETIGKDMLELNHFNWNR